MNDECAVQTKGDTGPIGHCFHVTKTFGLDSTEAACCFCGYRALYSPGRIDGAAEHGPGIVGARVPAGWKRVA